MSNSFILHPKIFPRGAKIFPVPSIYGHAFLCIFILFNGSRPEPGVPSAGTSYDNRIVKSQHIAAKNDTLINQ